MKNLTFILVLLSSLLIPTQALRVRPATDEERALGIVGAVYPTPGELRRCARQNRNSDLLIYNFLLSNPDGLGIGQAWSSNANEPVALLHPTDGETPFFISTFGQSGRFLMQFECSTNNEATFFRSIRNRRITFLESGEVSPSSFNSPAGSNPPRVNASRQLFVTRARGANPETTIISGGFNLRGQLSRSQVASLARPENISALQIRNNSASQVDFTLVSGRGRRRETINLSIGPGETSDVNFETIRAVRISIDSNVDQYDFDLLFPDLISSKVSL